jgi:hypothetical protein
MSTIYTYENIRSRLEKKKLKKSNMVNVTGGKREIEKHIERERER